MSESVPAEIRTKMQVRLQAISELAGYLGHADAAMSRDPAEWHRNLIRAFSDLAEEAKAAETELSVHAVQSKALTTTEVSKAAKVSRTAIYKSMRE
ncbi:hypothetical protein [Streptomyces olivaceus]|uniref:hypothetical protein n=1 Tax=Streptomyces olivaceus TaxID=47716 RepID=UPI0036435006